MLGAIFCKLMLIDDMQNVMNDTVSEKWNAMSQRSLQSEGSSKTFKNTYGDVFGILISTFNCFILLQNGKTFYSTSFFTKRNIHSYDIFRCHAVDHQIMDHDVLV